MGTYNKKEEMSRMKEEGWNKMQQLLDTYNTKKKTLCVQRIQAEGIEGIEGKET